MDISDWRRQIDAVDTAVLHLLNLRAGFALEVAKLKGKEGLSLRTPERERQIVERMKTLNTGPLDAEAIGRIYETIMSQCIRAQERSRDGQPSHTSGGSVPAKKGKAAK